MSTTSDLLSTCFLIRQQAASQITAQLQQLQQHTILQLATIRQQERTSSAAQRIILNQLRSHLSKDARSLLPTPEFADFVQDLHTGDSNPDLGLQVQPQPEDWFLPTLKLPLQLHDIDTHICAEAMNPHACETDLRVQVGTWQQTITFPAVLYTQDSPNAATARRQQWLAMADPLKAIAAQFEIASTQQEMAQQELYCLLSFTGDLFNLREIANVVNAQPTTPQWFP